MEDNKIKTTDTIKKIRMWSTRFFPISITALYFIAPFVFVVGIIDFVYLPQLAFIETITSLLLLLWLLMGRIDGELIIFENSLNLPLLIFILWSFASLFYAHNRYEALLPIVHLTTSAILFLLIVNKVREKRDKTMLLSSIFAAGYLTATLGTFQYLSGFSRIYQASSPAATFGNKNLAVHFIVLTIPLALPLIINSKNKLRPWVISIMAAQMASFLIYTRTRAGWLAFLAEFIFIAGIMTWDYISAGRPKYWSKNKFCSVAAGIMLFLLMINFTPDGFKWSFRAIINRGESITDTAAQSLRIGTWKATINIIKDNPLVGVGLGNLKVIFPPYQNSISGQIGYNENHIFRDAHNDYLQAAAEMGLIGILIIGWMGVILAKQVPELISPKTGQDKRFYAIALLAGLGGIMVNAFFCFPFERPIPPIIVAAFVALLTGWGGKNRYYRIEIKPLITALLAISVPASLFAGYFNSYTIKADRHLFRARVYEVSEEWDKVIIESEDGYAINQGRSELLSLAGKGYIRMGFYRPAIEVLKRALEKYPHNIAITHNLGVAYYSLEEYSEAVSAFKEALAINPNYANSLYYLGRTYLRQGKIEEGIQLLEKGVKLKPEIDSAGKIDRMLKHFYKSKK